MVYRKDDNGNDLPHVRDNLDYKKTTIGYTANQGSVQADHLEWWVSQNCWIQDLETGRPKYVYWKWTVKVLGFWVGGEYRTTYPSDSSYQKAYENAKSFDGVDYQYDFWTFKQSLDSTNKFWCSKLVWRAWYDVNSNHDLNYNHWWSVNTLSPLDIVQNSWRYQIRALNY